MVDSCAALIGYRDLKLSEEWKICTRAYYYYQRNVHLRYIDLGVHQERMIAIEAKSVNSHYE